MGKQTTNKTQAKPEATRRGMIGELEAQAMVRDGEAAKNIFGSRLRANFEDARFFVASPLLHRDCSHNLNHHLRLSPQSTCLAASVKCSVFAMCGLPLELQICWESRKVEQKKEGAQGWQVTHTWDHQQPALVGRTKNISHPSRDVASTRLLVPKPVDTSSSPPIQG